MSGQNQKTDKRRAWPIIIMNFTGVYDYEAFARNNKFIWLDCRHLYGTEGYCDRDGTLALKRMIADYPAEGVHFIDSGNYHYLTKFWTDKLETPFSLIVFDHHPDMQPPLFDNILSCGSWVKDILDHNNNCKKVKHSIFLKKNGKPSWIAGQTKNCSDLSGHPPAFNRISFFLLL